MLVAVDLDGTLDADPADMGSLMQALRAAGHRVVVATGAPEVTPEAIAAKHGYLKALGLGSSYDDLVVFPDPPHKAKAKWCKKHNVAILIDNSEETAKLAEDSCTVLLPWNSKAN